jgi:tRNA threonylcarbamoyladenosine biosynthesis protein TsaB
MYILHIETSTKVCSVALSRGDVLLEYIDLHEGMNHTAMLAPSIQEVLKMAAINPGELAAISVSCGPGSYTGLRVGCSTAKSMAYSLRIPLIAIPTLSALAGVAFDHYPLAALALPMLDARRNEVYTSMFDREMNQIVPTSSVILDSSAIDSLIPAGKTVVCCGDGAWKLNEVIMPNLTVDTRIPISARNLVGPAFKAFSEGHKSDPFHFVPDYLKPPHITSHKRLA